MNFSSILPPKSKTENPNLPTHTYADILALDPCYDPVERGYCTPDWTGTALDVLKADAVPALDRLWLVLGEGWIDDRTLRLFAVWCARKAMQLVEVPDPRSLEAIAVAERYAWGQATKVELAVARSAAWAAADDVASDPTWAGPRAAACIVAEYSPMEAAWFASFVVDEDAQIAYLIELLDPITNRNPPPFNP